MYRRNEYKETNICWEWKLKWSSEQQRDMVFGFFHEKRMRKCHQQNICFGWLNQSKNDTQIETEIVIAIRKTTIANNNNKLYNESEAAMSFSSGVFGVCCGAQMNMCAD